MVIVNGPSPSTVPTHRNRVPHAVPLVVLDHARTHENQGNVVLELDRRYLHDLGVAVGELINHQSRHGCQSFERRFTDGLTQS